MRLSWDSSKYELGVDRGVLYTTMGEAIPWNGLQSVNENNSSDNSAYFHNGIKMVNVHQLDTFAADVSAFTYPDVMDDENIFAGFCYRTRLGDDRYRVHVVYNPIFEINDNSFTSIGDSLSPISFAWGLSTTPVAVPGYAPTSHLIIEVSVLESYFLEYIEGGLYGTDTKAPKLLSAIEIIGLAKEIATFGVLIILDHGDGLWTAIGSDDMVKMLDETTFWIDSPSAIFTNPDTYTISSL